MSDVTIEGTVQPAAGVLRRGEQARVQYTDRIRRLINGGFVKVVTWHDPEPKASPSAPEGAPAPDLELPKRNASREDWAAWLTFKGVTFPADASRDEMVDYWDDATGQTEDAPDGT
jgi:hypothetical protein